MFLFNLHEPIKSSPHRLVATCQRSKLNSWWGRVIGQQADGSAFTHFLQSMRRKRATVNPAAWRSLQVCSEAEKRCNKQVPLPLCAPFILPYKSSALLALLRAKSLSSCLTLLQEHDRRPCHLKCLQQLDAPNLSSRQVHLWIIYFYVLSKGVDNSQEHPCLGEWVWPCLWSVWMMVRVEARKRHLLHQPTGTLYSQEFSTTQEDPVPPVTSLLESQKALLSCSQPNSPTHQEDTTGTEVIW